MFCTLSFGMLSIFYVILLTSEPESERLFALGMELPEESFVNIHGYNAVGETYGKLQSPV